MTYRIAQDFEYVGNDYWRWWAWIEAEGTELDKVKEVIWILHPTFNQSRVRVTDHSSKFQLRTAGWGTFLLRAEVVLKDDEKQLLKHNLRLEYPKPLTSPPADGPSGVPTPVRPLTVFLSYSAQDSRDASKLRQSLRKAGLDVLDQTRIDPGELLSDALKRMISQADAVVGLIGDDEISPWVSQELETAVGQDKPAFVLLSPQANAIAVPSGVRRIEIDVSQLDSSQIVDLLRSQTQD